MRILPIGRQTIDRFSGYCFRVKLEYEEWTLCDEDQAYLGDFQMHLRALAVSAYIKKNNIEPPSFTC